MGIHNLLPVCYTKFMYVRYRRSHWGKLQATVHSPEWVYTRPVSEIVEINKEELIFWSIKHVNALVDRCRTNVSHQALSPQLRGLIKTCATHAQNPAARLQAA